MAEPVKNPSLDLLKERVKAIDIKSAERDSLPKDSDWIVAVADSELNSLKHRIEKLEMAVEHGQERLISNMRLTTAILATLLVFAIFALSYVTTFGA